MLTAEVFTDMDFYFSTITIIDNNANHRSELAALLAPVASGSANATILISGAK
jgi:hypothetical protein